MARVEIDHAGLTALGDHVNHKFGDMALDMGVDAERYAPVRTGALKISVHVVEDSAGHWRIVAGTGLPDGRAVYQEMGTHNQDGTLRMRAQPYIRPAVYKKRAV
jgi:hypothetical protein